MTRKRVPVPTSGVIVPMVTPMRPDGGVDEESTTRLCEFLSSAGVTGLLVLGSTGENAALSRDERRRLLATVVAAAPGGVHVMAGVPALGTSDAARDAADYAALGADSILLPAPAGFPLSQSELGDHFRAVAAAIDIPIEAYEVPGRVHVSLGVDLLVELAKEGVIAGVKDSSGDLGTARMRGERLRRERLTIAHFTGSEECIDGFLLGGGGGCVPGLSNIVPRLHVALTRHAAAGEWAEASGIQGRITEWLPVYFQPVAGGSFMAQAMSGLKEALVQLGVIAHNTVADPFRQADDALIAHVRRLLATQADARP
ncbi:dihydrodipicolinate synthase family protein [Humibacter ginsengiterrae]